MSLLLTLNIFQNLSYAIKYKALLVLVKNVFWNISVITHDKIVHGCHALEEDNI